MSEEIKFEDLTDGQIAAHDGIMAMARKDFRDKSRKHILVKGQAGCGKSLLTKFVVESLVKEGIRGIILTAPTNQAKRVLSGLTGVEANTIHSILKIKPDTFEDVQVFEQSSVPKLEECQVLVCDEASFYNNKLFDILMRSVPSRCVIVAIGDEEQIRSVDPYDSHKSPFFKDPRFEVFELNEVKRAVGVILDLAIKVRNGHWTGAGEVQNADDGNESVSVLDDPKKILLEYMKNVKTPEDFKNNRIVAYTNKLVDSCNRAIRKRMYGKDVPDFLKDEVLVLQEPVMKKVSTGGVVIEETIFSNSELIRVLSCEYTSDFFTLPGVSGKTMIRYWSLTVSSEDDPKNTDVATFKVISEQEEQNKLNDILNNAALAYKDRSHRPAWKDFWRLKSSFKSVKYLPACTFHKSQGSSVDNAYVFASQVDSADHLTQEEKKELLYVGISRARKKLYLY